VISQSHSIEKSPAQRFTADRLKRDMTMHDLSDCLAHCNRNLPRGRSTAIWSADFPINKREVMRVELVREPAGRSTVDIRRWNVPANGGNSTAKGVAFDVRHLLPVVGLLNDLLRHVCDAGLLPIERCSVPIAKPEGHE
jgi:hypothetical protein